MRERIRKIGGELDLHTAPGKGTEIKIRIPFAN
jgi:signal transduction histidine kinase